MTVQAWSDPAKSAAMLERPPMGRFVEPAEVASVVLFLLGAEAAMASGMRIRIDGFGVR